MNFAVVAINDIQIMPGNSGYTSRNNTSLQAYICDIFLVEMFELKHIETHILLLKILIFGENSPFTPLLGELLLEEDVEDEGIGHESSKEEEDASCNCEQIFAGSVKNICWNCEHYLLEL